MSLDPFITEQIRQAEDGGPELTVADARPPEYSDEALALRFSAKHADDARFCAAWSRWLFWDSLHWRFDETLRAFDLARVICRVASAEISDPKGVKLAAMVASAKTVAAVVSLARADRRHAATVDQWDPDAWRFNTP
jgi:putative DNA primase/helicase